MITCNLTKLESALDQIKKSYPKLMPADAALIASALSLTGRHALAVNDGQSFVWPDDYEALTASFVAQIEMAQETVSEPTKKAAKAATVEEEPVQISLGLKPNLEAGEKVLEGREELKTLLSDIIQAGVEFVYNPTDIGWQWSLDRANWATVSGGELSRRIKIKTVFTEGAVGVEVGSTTKRRATKAKAVEAPVADADSEPEA